MTSIYDRIGQSYRKFRHPDPRIVDRIINLLALEKDIDTPRVKTTWILEVVYDGDKSTVVDAFLVKGLSLTPPSTSAISITDTAF
ncbi:MAG: hypothetical protein MUD14_01735 [Hydrococcus sp. Prado102]|jgi:hypothetical protein|nr:hypothetical protein [Hydrococcus sp. Prado102]